MSPALLRDATLHRVGEAAPRSRRPAADPPGRSGGAAPRGGLPDLYDATPRSSSARSRPLRRIPAPAAARARRSRVSASSSRARRRLRRVDEHAANRVPNERREGLQPSVLEPEQAVGDFAKPFVVAHDDDGRPLLLRQPAEYPHGLGAVVGVEVRRRLVREDERRAVAIARAIATRCFSPPESFSTGSRASRRDPCATRSIPCAVAGRPRVAGDVERDLDVLARGEGRDQVEVLEDEPEGAGRNGGRSRSSRAAMSVPSIQISPVVGRSRPPSMERKVVLPLPDGPISRTISPRSNSRSSPRTASTRVSPSPNVLARPRRRTRASLHRSTSGRRWRGRRAEMRITGTNARGEGDGAGDRERLGDIAALNREGQHRR